MFLATGGYKLLLMIFIVLTAIGPFVRQSLDHTKQFINVNGSLLRINPGGLTLYIVLTNLVSFIPTVADAMVVFTYRNKKAPQTDFLTSDLQLRPPVLKESSTASSSSSLSSSPALFRAQPTSAMLSPLPPLPQTPYNCNSATSVALDPKAYHTTHHSDYSFQKTKTHFWNVSQPIYTPIALISQERYQSKGTGSNAAKPREPPCFDPYEAVHVTAQLYSRARIPCTVHNIDFQSTVMSWWKEGSLRELTVGNEVSNSRYALDTSNPRSWTLVIQNVTKEDAGDYICQINLSKLREKFYRLTVLEPQSVKEFGRLNDVYVKDEAVGSANSSSREVKIESEAKAVIGKPHVLSCLAYFHRTDQTVGIQWFLHDRRIYPHTALDQPDEPSWPSSRPSTSIRLSSLTGQSIDVTNRWFSNRTLYSVLRISKLTKEFAGTWKCKKYSRNFFEPLTESTYVLTIEDPYSLTNANDSALKQPRFVSNQVSHAPQTIKDNYVLFLFPVFVLFYPERWETLKMSK